MDDCYSDLPSDLCNCGTVSISMEEENCRTEVFTSIDLKPQMDSDFSPANFVGNESDNQVSADSGSFTKDDSDNDSEDREIRHEKVGRWTFSLGASKRATKENNDKLIEKEKTALHSESQRLIRETEVVLPEHRPKQFKSFSEFRQQLMSVSNSCARAKSSNPSLFSQPVLDQNPYCSPLIPSDIQPTGNEAAQTIKREDELIKDKNNQTDQSAVSQEIPINLLSLNASQERQPMCSLLKLPQSVDDNECYIDLDSHIPSTPSDQLLTRLKQQFNTGTREVVRGPIEYTVLTKVQDQSSGMEKLQLDSVTYQPINTNVKTLPITDRRKQWGEHRKQLLEIMRKKRLQLYEERMNEEGSSEMVARPQNGTRSSSDDEWSEDDEVEDDVSDEDASDFDSTSTSQSGSADEEEEDIDENEYDDGDDVLNHKTNRRVCEFADDEAEESDDDKSSNSSTSSGSLRIKDKLTQLAKGENCTNQILESNNTNVHPFKLNNKFTGLDEFTDLANDPLVLENVPNLNYSYNTDVRPRRPQATLGPGDVDLFVSELSSILDRTTNASSVFTSSAVEEDQKLPFSRHSSTNSQWNNTPYELLYSQKPTTQQLLKSNSTITQIAPLASAAHSLSSQDTVLLSQDLSQSSSRLNEPHKMSRSSEDTQDSQDTHVKRCQMFSSSVVGQGYDVITQSSKSQMSEKHLIDSQDVHAEHRRLFGGSILEQDQKCAENGNVDFGLRTESTGSNMDEKYFTSSQDVHARRCQMFGSSITTQDKQCDDIENVSACIMTNSSESKPNEDDLLELTSSQLNQMTHADLFADLTTTRTGTVDFENPLSPSTNSTSLNDSQNAHAKRCQMFAGSIIGQHHEITTECGKFEINPNDLNDSQDVHTKRYQMFGSSILAWEPQSSDDHAETSKQSTESEMNAHNLDMGTSGKSEQITASQNVLSESNATPVKSSIIHRRRIKLYDSEDEDDDVDDDDDDNNNNNKLAKVESYIVKSAVSSTSNDCDSVENAHFSHDDSVTQDVITNEENDSTDKEEEEEEEDTRTAQGEFENGEETEIDTTTTDDGDDEEEIQRREINVDKYVAKIKKKKIRVKDYVDEEAELSGDENERAYYMDDEDEEACNDEDLEDLKNLIVDDDQDPALSGRLRRQLERVHHRLQTDQDLRELRYLKELYFEDGDLYDDDGKTRQRRFRWRGLDNDDQFDPFNNGSSGDDDDGTEEHGNAVFGPMDKWLHRTDVTASDKLQTPQNVDLDAQQMKCNTEVEQAVIDLDASDSEDEKENCVEVTSVLDMPVLSFGKEAIRKVQMKQAQMVVQRNKSVLNGKSVLQSAVNAYATSPSKSTSKGHPQGDVLTGPNIGEHHRLIKRGSLLSRQITHLHQSEPCSRTVPERVGGTKRRNQPHFFGLRNKVGLSCFNVRPEMDDDDRTHVQIGDGAPLNHRHPQKRSSVLLKKQPAVLSPPSLKRHRSVSVFSAF